MLHYLSQNIADFLLSQNCFDDEDLDIYIYGTELVLSSLLSCFIILITSIVMNCLLKGFLFFICFVTLRKFTGGLHCKTYLRCNLTFISVYLGCLVCNTVVEQIKYKAIIYIALIIISLIIVYLLSPVENINKPISDDEKKKYRRIAVVVCFLQIILFVVLKLLNISDASIIVFTIFAVALSMQAGLYNTKESR